jgi:hypothetical protein
MLPTLAGSDSAARTAEQGDRPRPVDSQPPANDALRLTETRDLGLRQEGAGVAGSYDWPYREFARDYAHFGTRYRDYARDYGNFAYDYSWFAPRYRDYARDYGEFAYDYQPKPRYRLPAAATGQVVVDVLPTSARVFVDGLYIGMSYELSAGFTLEAGPHRLEVRADDYESARLDMMIEPGHLSRYEGTLVRRNAQPEGEPPTARAEVPSTPMTVYFIPRCYLGNVPPTAARLPVGCDMKDLKVMPR